MMQISIASPSVILFNKYKCYYNGVPMYYHKLTPACISSTTRLIYLLIT